jgi:hypothetical protein
MKSNIGDILIQFGSREPVHLTRSRGAWVQAAQFGDATVWLTPVDDDWAGFPLTTYQDERWQVWALGEFYPLQQKLTRALDDGRELYGHFLLLAYEVEARRWYVITNRFGTVHAYYAEDGKRAALGTFSPAVAAAASRKELNFTALGGFFTFGFFLGDSTYWQDLRIIKPATHLVLDERGQVLNVYQNWHWAHTPNEHEFGYDDAHLAFGKRFDAVLSEQAGGKKIALPLSGGLDSRSTLDPLTKNRPYGAPESIFAYSYGYSKHSAELRIAKALAKKRELDLHRAVIHPYLYGKIEQLTRTLEGFQDITQPRQACVVDWLGAEATHVVAAHWGDVWLDDMGFLDYQGLTWDLVLAVVLEEKFRKQGSEILLDLFAEALPGDLQKQNVLSIAKDLHALSAIQDVDFKVKAWKTNQWSFRWTLASLRTYQIGLFPLLPFYHPMLTDFFCYLPARMVESRKLQIAYLKRFAPDLARVTWQVYDANLYNYQHFNTWQLPKRAIKKLGRVLRWRRVIERNWEVQFLNPHGRELLEERLLTRGLKLHTLVPRAKLAGFIKDFYQHPGAGNGYVASMLLTFSAWLEMYG